MGKQMVKRPGGQLKKRPCGLLKPIPPKPPAVPAGASNYDLLPARPPQVIKCAGGRFIGVEYEVALRLSAERVRKNRCWHSTALKFKTQPRHASNPDGFWDIELEASGFKTTYRRLVGLSLNLCCWGLDKKRLSKPFKVPLKEWRNYRVHHINWNPWDCRLQILAPIHRDLRASLKKGELLPGPVMPIPNLWS